jgi:YegS/Rv2252/BmrU family lipid kinase
LTLVSGAEWVKIRFFGTRTRLRSTISIIVNPIAGGAGNGALLNRLVAQLGKLGHRTEVRITGSRGDARRFAAEASSETLLVAAMGGDGTVNEVVDGLVGRDIPLLVVPCGTENLLAKYLRIPRDVDFLAAAAHRPRFRRFDIATANGRRFVCVSGVGFDAEVLRWLEARRRGHIEHLDYFWPLWRTFWGWRFPTIRVEVDDKEFFRGRGLAFVGNTNRYAIGLKITRDAIPDDGLLDVCIYECASHTRLLLHSVVTLAARHVGRPGVVYGRGKRVRISSDAEQWVEVDGERVFKAPVEYGIIPQGIRLVAGPA